MKTLLLILLLFPFIAFSQSKYAFIKVITPRGNEAVIPYATTNTFPPDGNVGIGTMNPSVKLDIIGGNIRFTSSLYTSSLLIQSTSNNEMELIFGGVATIIGATANGVSYFDFGLARGKFNNKGLQYSANSGDTALWNQYGNSWFGQSSLSRLYFGAVADDGAGTKVQALSIGSYSYRLTPASTPGYVMIVAPDGHGLIPSLNSGGSSTLASGTFTPTYTIEQNITAGTVNFQTCYYTRVGNIVHVHIAGSLKATSDNTLCLIKFSLPISTSASATSLNGVTNFYSSTTANFPYSSCNVQPATDEVEFAGYAGTGVGGVISNFIFDFTYSTQ